MKIATLILSFGIATGGLYLTSSAGPEILSPAPTQRGAPDATGPTPLAPARPATTVASQSPAAAPQSGVGTAIESGTATWCAPTPKHCQSWGGSAKLGAVQSFTFGDKPYRAEVCLNGKRPCVTVTVVSFCACGNTLIDLSPAAFRRLAPLSRGRVRVTVESRGAAVLPPTDTGP